MKGLSLLLLATLLLPVKVKASTLKVLTQELSIREKPRGKIVETVNKEVELPLLNLIKNWGRSQRGWLNCDFTDYNFKKFNLTGKIELKIAKVVEPIKNLKRGDILIVYKELPDKVIGLFKGNLVEAGKENLQVELWNLDIVVTNFPIELEDLVGNRRRVKAGKAMLRGTNGYLFDGHLYERAKELYEKRKLKKEELLKELNRLIDIYNSVKLSSPLSERLGYYVKTLPIKSQDLKIIRTKSGVGVYIKVKHQFVTRDGRPITGRKTRFFLKKSNFEFWRKLTEEAFKSGVDKFVEIDVFRFDGKGNYEMGGFIASSYHTFKEGKIKDYVSFVENSESNLIEDLWFFADQVYERLEGGN